MIIDFSDIQETVMQNFNGGEKEFRANMMVDELNKIMRGKLIPGASIGLHEHTAGSEILYVLKGNGKVIYDGEIEKIKEGQCHYCKKGHSHSLINDGDSDLVFFAVVPQQ